MAHIVIIDYDHGTKHGRWQVNLTDGARVWDRARVDDPRRALGRVEQHQRAGHTVISEAARADLATAAFYRMLEWTEHLVRYTARHTLDLVHQHGGRLPTPDALAAAPDSPDLPPAA